MYNFLDSKLKPHATSSCPSTDGYEATNLISDDYSLKSKGFLAYSAIKPPVDIDFNFICPINIHCILIWNSVGSLKTIGFELLLKNTTFDFTTVAKVYSKESDGVAIFNRIHSTSTKFHVPQHFSKDFFKTNHLKMLTCADKLKMRIFRTQTGAPCIGKIEVWGEISRTCTQTTMDTIKYLMSKTNQSESSHQTLNVPSTSKNPKLKDDFNIPEDFIDPITFQIMSLPITLPSGKTIDQSTLEKHKESEAKWGRNLSDPFTGQIFTSTRKPALNSGLKSRIDAFLLKNANVKETFNIQRTVGRRKPENTIAVNLENLKTENNIETNQPQTNVSDLDEAIRNALNNNMLVRFTLDNDSKNEPDNNKVCGICDSDSNLYILICEHYICRHCLLSNAAGNRCKICNKTFSRSDIKKFYN